MIRVHLAHVAMVSGAHHHEGADPDVLLVHPRRVPCNVAASDRTSIKVTPTLLLRSACAW